MNQVLNRLEDLGAVTRPHESASRTLPAQLTPEGLKLLKRILYKAGDCSDDIAAPRQE